MSMKNNTKEKINKKKMSLSQIRVLTLEEKENIDILTNLVNNLFIDSNDYDNETLINVIDALYEDIEDKKWKKKIVKFLDSSPILITMSILTIWALFASDICYAFLSIKVDEAFNIIQCILLGLFSLEFILTCISKENYMFSFFFFLDFISTVSLIQDIDYVMDPIMGYAPIQDDKISKNGKRKSAQAAKAISKVSTASRATRVLRVIRIVRLIRMVKLYKNVLIAKEKKEILKEEQKKKINIILVI